MFLNHNFTASLTLFSIQNIFFTLPVSETSHINIVSLGIGLFNLDEIILHAILKSIQGSNTFIHLTIFT